MTCHTTLLGVLNKCEVSESIQKEVAIMTLQLIDYHVTPHNQSLTIIEFTILKFQT